MIKGFVNIRHGLAFFKSCRIGTAVEFKHKVDRTTFLLYINFIYLAQINSSTFF